MFCRQIRTFLVTSHEVILSRKSNLTCFINFMFVIILLDAMVQVPYGNCFSRLKKNSQTLREERSLQLPMVNNETIMLSECATLLRDIRFEIRVLVKNVVSFSFTLDWFLFFISFLLQARKRRKQLALSAVSNVWTNYSKQELQGRTSSLIILLCQSVLLTFSVKNWVR